MDKKHTIRLALVDDNRPLRAAVWQFLEKRGFQILWEAGNSEESLKNIQSHATLPDICIVDINMPVIL